MHGSFSLMALAGDSLAEALLSDILSETNNAPGSEWQPARTNLPELLPAKLLTLPALLLTTSPGLDISGVSHERGGAVLLFDPESWRRWHRTWFRICGIVALLAVAWFIIDAFRTGIWPGGSSAPGLTAGIVAGLLMIYLFTFALRKWPPCYSWYRLFPTKFWLGQHIWFGLLTLPLVLIHGWKGPLARWWGGGALTLLTVYLLIFYAIVMISGIWGLWRQQRVPRNLLEDIPDETIQSQIPILLNQLRREAELLVLATCGPPPDANGAAKALQILKDNEDIITAARRGKGTGLLHVLPAVPVADCEPLRVYFEQVIEPYLKTESSSGARLRMRARMKADFGDLRGRLRPEAQPVIDALEQVCERRTQFDQQSQMQGKLFGWIAFHLACSAVLLVLLGWHAVTAVTYW
jgi:hypothetical protein